MRRKTLLILIPILVLIIIATVITILYFTTDLFRTDEELFWKYFAQNEDIMDILKNENISIQNNFKNNNSYVSNGNLDFVALQGENSSKQLNIETTSRHDANTNRTYAEAILKNGDINLFTVSYINNNDIYAIQCSEVYQYYIGFQNSGLTELAANYGLSNIPESINFDEITQIFNLTDEQKNHIINTYLPIIQNEVDDTQYSSFNNESIEIEGQNYEANKYVISLSGTEAKNILINILNGLKSDTETQLILSNKLSSLCLGEEYTDTTNLVSKIDELIQNIQSAELNNNIIINVYEQDGNTIYTSIEAGKYIISYNRLNNIKKLNISIESKVETNTDIIDTNEIIDLNNYATNSDNTITFEIEISKTTLESIVTNEIKIIPDSSNSGSYIDIGIGFGNIQNESYSNSYFVEVSNSEGDSINVNTIKYDTNTTKAEQVKEIAELTGANTVIANNYPAEQFTAFLNAFVNSFRQVFENKLATIGFEL